MPPPGVAEGILRGKLTEDGAVFSCEEPISFSEAATVLNRVLDLGNVELEVWFADREAAPLLGGAGRGEHGSTECPQRGQFRK